MKTLPQMRHERQALLDQAAELNNKFTNGRNMPAEASQELDTLLTKIEELNAQMDVYKTAAADKAATDGETKNSGEQKYCETLLTSAPTLANAVQETALRTAFNSMNLCAVLLGCAPRRAYKMHWLVVLIPLVVFYCQVR